jgi:hypothetical protein
MLRQCFAKSHLHFHVFKRAAKWFENSKDAFTARKLRYWGAFEKTQSFVKGFRQQSLVKVTFPTSLPRFKIFVLLILRLTITRDERTSEIATSPSPGSPYDTCLPPMRIPPTPASRSGPYRCSPLEPHIPQSPRFF